MNPKDVVKSSQEQAVAAWIDAMNHLRVAEMMERLLKQKGNYKNALYELESARQDIFELLRSNRGGAKGSHGFIAERTQVAIENARSLLDGLEINAFWSNNNGPTDFVVNGTNVQQKFVQSNCGLGEIFRHLQKYPSYAKSGNVYQIPKDFYERLSSVWDLSAEQAGKLPNRDYSLWKAAQDFFDKTGLDKSKIQPSDLTYEQVQAGQINSTLRDLETKTGEQNQQRNKEIQDSGAPSWQEGAEVAAISAAVEAGTNFLLAIEQKRKSGKQLADFTVDDWKEVGLYTGKGGIIGVVRGGAVYAMTNLAGTPAPVASAFVTAVFGVLSQAILLENGEISETEFVENSELFCIGASVSAVSSLLGEIIIPVPFLGAIIGNAVGTILYEISKDYLDERETELISQYCVEINSLNARLSAQFRALVRQLQDEFSKFSSLLDWAFDPDINTAFLGSIQLADYVGVSHEKVLRTQADIDRYFLS